MTGKNKLEQSYFGNSPSSFSPINNTNTKSTSRTNSNINNWDNLNKNNNFNNNTCYNKRKTAEATTTKSSNNTNNNDKSVILIEDVLLIWEPYFTLSFNALSKNSYKFSIKSSNSKLLARFSVDIFSLDVIKHFFQFHYNLLLVKKTGTFLK